MSWLFSWPRDVETKHNGTMRLHRLFGVWKLMGRDGTEQGTPYMDGLWRKVLRAVARRGMRPSRCLVLGVAMGGTLTLLRKRWPDAAITGIDWEPALFALGKELGVFHDDARTTFVEGDAAAEVPRLAGTFDLVLIDLFDGRNVATAVSDPTLIDAVIAHTAPGGVVALNYYNQPSTVEGWKARLGEPAVIRFQGNRIATFTRK